MIDFKENYYDHFQKQMEILRAEKDNEREIAVQMEKEKLEAVQEDKVCHPKIVNNGGVLGLIM